MIRRSPARRLLWASAGFLLVASGAVLVVRAAPKGDPGRLREEARAAVASRRWDRAEDALARLSSLDPDRAEDWLLRARVHSARGRDEEALGDLARIPDDHAEAPQAQLLRGTIELHRLRPRAAEAAFRRALELDPRLAQAHWGLAMIATLQMRRDGVFDALRSMADLVPLTFEQALLWTQVHGSNWDPDWVVPQLRKALEGDPGDRQIRLALAEGLRQLGREEETREVLGPLAATDPEATAIRALIALESGEEATARELLAQGPPDHPELALLRGQMALMRGDGPEAAAQFRVALKVMPDRRECVWGLAQAHRLVGQHEEAAKLSTTAQRIDSLGGLVRSASTRGRRDDPKFLRELGAACESLGFHPEARAWYALAVDRDPTSIEAQAALRRLGPSPTGGRPYSH